MEEPAPKQHAIFNASSWTEAGPPTGQRIALHKLAAALRKINEALVDKPELVNESCYGTGWLIRLRPSDPSQIAALLDAAAYRKSVESRES